MAVSRASCSLARDPIASSPPQKKVTHRLPGPHFHRTFNGASKTLELADPELFHTFLARA